MSNVKESYLYGVLDNIRMNAESMTEEDLKRIVGEVWDSLNDDCPNYESCSEQARENYEPMYNEGHF